MSSLEETIVNFLRDNPILIYGEDSDVDADNIVEDILMVLQRYKQPHRKYHTLEHIERFLQRLSFKALDPIELGIQQIAALFHDVHYDPTAGEEKNIALSIKFFEDVFQQHVAAEYVPTIKAYIQATGNYTVDVHPHRHDPIDEFKQVDIDCFFDVQFWKLLEHEKQIFQEYQFVDVSTYRQKRVEILRKLQEAWDNRIDPQINSLIEAVEGQTYNIGLYVGSFNPIFHTGHMSVLEKAEKMFDKVIVVQGVNPDKARSVLTPQYELQKFMTQILPYHETDVHPGLTTDYVKKLEAQNCNVTIVRGLRNGFDLEYETNQVRAMQDLYPGVKVIYVNTDCNVQHVSGTMIRTLQTFNQDISKYTPRKYAY